MSREDQARQVAAQALDDEAGTSFVYSVRVREHGSVTFSADGRTAFVEALVTVELPE